MRTLLTRVSKWLAVRLENVPVFWAVYALILVETVGEGVLAIPIAVAKIGPLAGLAVLILMGIINMITIASIAEASARNGSIRYGGSYLGRIVQDYLGSTGTFVLVLGVAAIQLPALISYYVGFSVTMAEATRTPATTWAAAIFLVCFYYLRKGSFASTTALVMLIGGINVGAILALSFLSIPHVQLENILHTSISLSGAEVFDPSVLQLVFGVISSAYLGHLGVANSAQLALRRDASARSLVLGSIAAQATLIVVYCLWVIVVNGAVTPEVLANETGTVLVPLASQIGLSSYVLGSVLIFLGIGVASVVTALALFCMVREWLPKSILTPGGLERCASRRMSEVLSRVLLGRRGQFWLSASPILAVFVYVEWLLLTGKQSFTVPLSFLGVLAAPLIAGVFPVLLLVASRAKGDRPLRCCPEWLGNPLMLAGIYFVFVVNLFVHGFFIWQGPLERGAALMVGIAVLAMPVVLIRQGVFGSRSVIELRRAAQPESGGSFAVVSRGELVVASVQMKHLGYEATYSSAGGTIPDFSSLRRVQFQLDGHATELKVWVHQETADGDSEGIPVRLTVATAESTSTFESRSRSGKILVPISKGSIDLEMELLAC